ncbi:MAG: hypothetical protein PHW60_04385 [Kiritimatiellae bacterium]|nr:hypothetical protein [Kiritimatiellia bacterium]
MGETIHLKHYSILLVHILSLLCLPLSAQANLMPVYEDLRRTESAHFIYIYQVSLGPQIPPLIRLSEEAYDLLTPALRWTPRGKTAILYADTMDEHNGSAWVYPRPTILLYAAGSSPGSTIYEPGLFLRRTVLHEYAHVLSMDAQYGADAFLNAIFGRVMPAGDFLSLVLAACAAPPGFLAPTWYLEGLSIWAETEFSSSGRGRTSVADMIMRMPFADQRVLSASRWDLALPEWPYGNAAYLYGMKTIEYAQALSAQTNGQPDLPGNLSDDVAHSFLYFFDNCAKPALGMTFNRMTRAALVQAQSCQQERIRRLQSHPLTPLTRLTPGALQVADPQFGADGSAVFFAGHPEAGRDVLYRYDRTTKRVQRVEGARVDFDSTSLAVPEDHELIYYTRLNVIGRDRIWNELHCYDPAKQTQTLVTREGRYRFPAIAPDGRILAAVRNEGGRFSLLEVPLAQAGNRRAETIRALAPPFHSIVDPAYAPDGKHLVYVLANDAHSQLRNIDLDTGNDTLLVDWPCIIITPLFHPSGSNLVFVADRNGVYNLYRFPLPFGEVLAITHALGGVFTPDFSPDGRELAVAAYDSRGYYLSLLNVESLSPPSFPLPELKPDWPSLPRDAERFKQSPAWAVTTALATNAPSKTNTPDSVVSQPYNSLSGVRLDYWTPWLTVANGAIEGGLASACSDYTQAQNIFALAGAESRWGTPLGALVYQYSGFYPILTAFGNYGPESYYDLVKDRSGYLYDYNEKVGQAGGMVTLPRVRIDSRADFSFGWQGTDRKVIPKSAEDYAGRPLVTSNLFEGTESALFAQMTFFNATSFGRSASFEDGRAVSATIERADKAFGGDLSQTRVLGQWVEYVPVVWADNHVLRLEGVGAAGQGDETAQSFFGLGGYGVVQQVASPGLNRSVILRGYNPNSQVGRYLVKAGAAYRFPMMSYYRGADATLPLYMHQLFGELYYEGGHAWSGDATGALDACWLNAVGFELNLSLTLFRYAQIAPGLGVVYAFDRKDPNPGASGDDVENQKLQLYLSIKAVVNF